MPLHDLNQAQLRTLRALAKEKKPIPVAELAEKLGARRLLDLGVARAVDKNGNSWAFPIPASEVAGYQATDEIRYLVTGR